MAEKFEKKYTPNKNIIYYCPGCARGYTAVLECEGITNAEDAAYSVDSSQPDERDERDERDESDSVLFDDTIKTWVGQEETR